MMSKDTYSLERNNTLDSAVINQSSGLMAKLSSINISPSAFSPPSSLISWSDTQVTQLSHGKSLRLRCKQDASSKLEIL